MVRLIGDKNVQLMDKIEVISKKTLREKIMAYLHQQSMEQNSKHFTIPLGWLELAEYLCADRSALTRELSYMQKDGLICYEKNTFKLLLWYFLETNCNSKAKHKTTKFLMTER